MNEQISIIPSQDIDAAKWDDCIRQSNNAVIYAYSYYLNHLAGNWSAIVFNDYEAVMPVCWRKKFGIKYSCDVPFVQQLGWFSKNEIANASSLLKTFFSSFSYGDYVFNFGNNIDISNAVSRCNYILPLSCLYADIKENYKTDVLSNLKKASKEEFMYADENIDAAVELYKTLYHSRFRNITKNDFINFKRLCLYLLKDNAVLARKICNQKNETLAVALLLKDATRLYNIMNSTTGEGRRTGANHFLFDNIFKEFAGNGLVFDFEGSDVPGIKSFYEKFGAINQPYHRLHFNHLPLPLRLLKR